MVAIAAQQRAASGHLTVTIHPSEETRAALAQLATLDEDPVSLALRERPSDAPYTAWLLAMPDGPTRGRALCELRAVASVVVAMRAMLQEAPCG